MGTMEDLQLFLGLHQTLCAERDQLRIDFEEQTEKMEGMEKKGSIGRRTPLDDIRAVMITLKLKNAKSKYEPWVRKLVRMISPTWPRADEMFSNAANTSEDVTIDDLALGEYSDLTDTEAQINGELFTLIGNSGGRQRRGQSNLHCKKLQWLGAWRLLCGRIHPTSECANVLRQKRHSTVSVACTCATSPVITIDECESKLQGLKDKKSKAMMDSDTTTFQGRKLCPPKLESHLKIFANTLSDYEDTKNAIIRYPEEQAGTISPQQCRSTAPALRKSRVRSTRRTNKRSTATSTSYPKARARATTTAGNATIVGSGDNRQELPRKEAEHQGFRGIIRIRII